MTTKIFCKIKTNLLLTLTTVFIFLPLSTFASYLTLPINPSDYTYISTMFDHTTPRVNGVDQFPGLMTRYDGIDPGCTPGYDCFDGHAGIDYATGGVGGKNILAAATGIVRQIQWENPGDHNQGYGYYIRLWHSGYSLSTLYAHLQENSQQSGVSIGAVVDRYKIIAKSGDTGEGGFHLHFNAFNADTPDKNYTVDPYGWSGNGQPDLRTSDPNDVYQSDPWSNDIGYLWTTNPPSLPSPPTVSSISPSSGINTGPNSISSVNGSNFNIGTDISESNLKGHWRLDEVTGSQLDYSGNNNTGAPYGPADTPGRLHRGKNFDGTDDYISIPDSTSLSPTGDTTISFWMKRGRSGIAEYVMSKYNSQTSQVSFETLLWTDNKLRVTFCGNGSCSVYRRVWTTSAIPTDGVWRHVAAVFTSGGSADAKVYVDGVDVSASKTGTATSLFDSTAPISLSSVVDSL